MTGGEILERYSNTHSDYTVGDFIKDAPLIEGMIEKYDSWKTAETIFIKYKDHEKNDRNNVISNGQAYFAG